MNVLVLGAVVLAIGGGLLWVAAHVANKIMRFLRHFTLLYRLISGQPLDGQRRHDGSFFQAPTKALHPTAASSWWHWRPGWHRSAMRLGALALVLLVATGLAFARTLTEDVILAVIAAAILLLAWHIAYRIRNFPHERHYVRPVERTLAATGLPAPLTLEVERDGDTVKAVAIEWSPETEIKSIDQDAVLEAVTKRLAIEAPEASWKLKGRQRSVVFTQSEPPPSYVEWDAIADAVKRAAPNELVFGIGKREAVIKAAYSESPHLAIPGGSGGGKALALDTRLPTPGGWTTMSDVAPGDLVYDETGSPVRVIAATEVMYGRRCYEVQFSDGSVIVADGDHQWLAETFAYRKAISCGRTHHRASRRGGPTPSWMPEVVTTEVMARTLRVGKHSNYGVRVAGPLQSSDAELPVPPYTLGAWLGDGATVTGSITSADPEIISEIEAEGETTWVVPSTVKANHASYRVKGLNVRLRAAGVLGNKHIPVTYLRASEAQRRALLAGLLDTDGYVAADGGVAYYSTVERLARDAYHLVAALGYKPTLRSKTATLYGKACGTVWIVTFTPADKVFRLPRKMSRQIIKVRPTAALRYVTEIRPVPSVPVRCIEVDSPSHLYLAGETCIPTHNSNVAALLLLQEMMRGSLIFNLDPKWISHPWLIGLPNVINAHSPEHLHLALCWLGRELPRRTQVAWRSAAGTGIVRAKVGTRIIVLAEELNYGMPGLKDYWREIREKEDAKQSPAVAALQALSCAGRASEIHEYLIAQLLTVESTGVKDSTIRTNAGIKAMARWDGPGWAMAVGKHVPMPPQTTTPGRLQVVTGAGVRETQVPYLHLDDKDEAVAEEAVKWARELAVSGVVAQIPSGPEGIPSQLWPASVVGRPQLSSVPAQGGGSPKDTRQIPAMISLRQAVAEETLRFTGRDPLAAARKAAQRPGFPAVAGWDGQTALYYRSELREWQDGKVRVLR